MADKEALLVYGAPLEEEDKGKFIRDTSKDLNIMRDISEVNGYSCSEVFMENMKDYLKSFEKKDLSSFLFYFTGHADENHLGDNKYKTNEIMESFDKIGGRKYIFLDACAGNYNGGENFSSLKVPRNSKIITLKESFPNKSLAKLLYDLNSRGYSLESINNEALEELKMGGIYYKESL